VSPDATYTEQEGAKYSEASDHEVSVNMEEMCGPKLLNLNQEQIDYWMKRHRIYREERQPYWPAMETRQARERKAELAKNDECGTAEGWQGFQTMFRDEN
jgi:hypothetical protein